MNSSVAQHAPALLHRPPSVRRRQRALRLGSLDHSRGLYRAYHHRQGEAENFTPMPHNKCESAPEGPLTPSTVLATRRSHRPTRLLLLRRHGRRESGPPRSSQTVSNIPGRHINTMRRFQPDANINVAYPTLRPTRHNLLLTSASEHTAHRS